MSSPRIQKILIQPRESTEKPFYKTVIKSGVQDIIEIFESIFPPLKTCRRRCERKAKKAQQVAHIKETLGIQTQQTGMFAFFAKTFSEPFSKGAEEHTENHTDSKNGSKM